MTRFVIRAECCPLAKVRIYSEELRSLREALQLIVARGEAPGSNADGKGGEPSGGKGVDCATGRGRSMAPIAESAAAESSTSRPQQDSPPSTLPVPPVSFNPHPFYFNY